MTGQLVSQRLINRSRYVAGEKPSFPAYHDYKSHRLSEAFRLSESMEDFLEYVLYLEGRVNDTPN